MKRSGIRIILYLGIGVALLGTVYAQRPRIKRMVAAERAKNMTSVGTLDPIAMEDSPTARMVNRAKLEAKNGVLYDASYAQIPYPLGDVSQDIGACTDVVIRSARAGGIDLQAEIQKDYRANSSGYKIKSPDPNIDHRRCPNQICWLKRHAQTLTIETNEASKKSWQAGDIVYWKLGNLDHTGVVSNAMGSHGLPLVIHNLSKTVQEDCLDSWEIVGHFRLFEKDPPLKKTL